MSRSALEMSSERRGDMAVLAFAGELDIASAARVEEELTALEEAGPGVLVLDLSGLDFMDSTGLRIVVGADQRARERGGRVAVVRGKDPVQRIFRMTRLEDRLEMVGSAEEVGAAG